MPPPVGAQPPYELDKTASEIQRSQLAFRKGQVGLFDLTSLVSKRRGLPGGLRVRMTYVLYEGDVGNPDNGVARRYLLFTSDQDYIVTGLRDLKMDYATHVPDNVNHNREYWIFVPTSGVAPTPAYPQGLVMGKPRQNDCARSQPNLYIPRGGQIIMFVANVAADHEFTTWMNLVPVDNRFDRLPGAEGEAEDALSVAAIPAAGTHAPSLRWDTHLGGDLGGGIAVP